MRESLGHEAGVWFLENLAHLVPGYQGYRERDLRRAEDARLRAQVLERMADIRAAIEAWSETLPDGIDQDCAQAIERRAARLDSLADAIRYAPYAFSGFFDATVVREETVERVLELDLLLFEDLRKLDLLLDVAPRPPRALARIEPLLSELDATIEAIEVHLIQRDKALGDC